MTDSQTSRRRRIAGERRPTPRTIATAPSPAEEPARRRPRRQRPAPETTRGVGAAGREDRQVKRPVPLPLVYLVGLLAVVLTGLAAWYGIPRYLDVRGHQADETAGRAAQSAAERAAVAVMSYGYKTLDSDETAAMRFMTADMAHRYQGTFDASVKPNAPTLKATVTADLLASGVVNVSGDRADVLLYVNQTTVSTANGGDPQVAENRVVFRMVKVDGSWLVDRITPK